MKTPTEVLQKNWGLFKQRFARKIMKKGLEKPEYKFTVDYLVITKSYLSEQPLSLSWSSKYNARYKLKLALGRLQIQTAKFNEIFPALVFWKFLRGVEHVGEEGEKYKAHENFVYQNATFEEKRKFLSLFVSDKQNPYIRLIAMIESMPAEMWRKILWKENIDFLSYESFLRRITNEQIEAIRVNYIELMSGNVIPQVYKETLGDKISIFWKSITPASIKEATYDVQKRNLSKGAWAFNLLGLDFGFSLYPNGIEDDTKITNQKFSRFLSLKNHIHDFIVNQENGLYWMLYKMARSNYVIRSGKKVELKTHICPGFWWTLISHLVFWLISPMLFTTSAIYLVTDGNLSLGVVGMVMSSVTPLWILSASVKFTWKKFSSLFGRFRGAVEKIGVGLSMIGTAWAVLVLTYLIGWGTYESILFFSQSLGFTIAWLAVSCALYYVGFSAWFIFMKMNYKYAEYSDIPRQTRKILHFVMLMTAIKLFDYYLMAPSLALMVKTGTLLWGYIIQHYLMFTWEVLTLTSVILTVKLSSHYFADEAKFVRSQRAILFVNKWWVISSVVIGSLGAMSEGFELSSVVNRFLIDVVFYVIISVIVFYGVTLFVMFTTVNEDNIESRLTAKRYIDLFFDKKVSETYFGKLKTALLKNSWFMELPELKSKKVMDRVVEFLDESLFTDYNSGITEKYKADFLSKLIPLLDSRILGILMKHKKTLVIEIDTKDRIECLMYLVKGGKLGDFILQMKKKRKKEKLRSERKRKRQERRKVFFDWLFGPLRRLREKILTVKDLWELFNERCPYVSRSKIIE